HCFGDDHTFEDGEECYNIFLEYAARGTLFDQLKNYGGKLPETLVRCYTRSILEGLKYVHENDFVHCDVKLQNILVFEDGNVKLSDFGLAKEKGLKNGKLECRGTPMFISPEAVNDNIYESPTDIWALGCAVVEMATGKPAWNFSGSNIWSLLIRIGVGDELPLIPDELSQEGKDFLQKIFVKDPLKRWTAEMLLKHPFISDDKNISSVKESIHEPSSLSSPSPRTHLNFPTEFEYDFCSPGEILQRLVEDQRFVRLVRI
ncbi:mitogen-activated protein kinase kinase kinase 3-like protein, partial [Trifolium pratense]